MPGIDQLRAAINQIRGRIRAVQSSEPYLYHFDYQGIGERSRIHLRIDPDGRGLLMVNASQVVTLNPTAALMAKLALEECAPALAAKTIKKKYRVPHEQALHDYTQFKHQLDELIRPEGACPVHDLDFEITAPFSARPSAPYRMDLALTYRCNNACAHCYNARARSHPELSTEDWFKILDRLWGIGIPHIVFIVKQEWKMKFIFSVTVIMQNRSSLF